MENQEVSPLTKLAKVRQRKYLPTTEGADVFAFRYNSLRGNHKQPMQCACEN
ncbi:MAG: hypothetical protein LBI27_04130 [Clostridiales bacterium]|nr:hypothetical protein [Clostridiales bacterium]